MTKSDEIKELPEILPEMIVFDLDYTLWSEWIDCTYGPPYTYEEKNNSIVNHRGEVLSLFEHTTAIISTIKSFPNTKIAIASRTSTPEWARKALRLLRIPELDSTLEQNIDYFEIYPGSKIKHFKALSKKSGIECHKMLFFDDESRNREVTKLGAHFVQVNTRKGITPTQFMTALHNYANNTSPKQPKLEDHY
ncbi:magnesium-dependent phosphatase-1 [Choanephora cucurbitarum]|nr:magnesium-dependent phosphatase-1 [Choanephora cucurbitarum]